MAGLYGRECNHAGPRIYFGVHYMEIFLESRKNDQFREGHWIAISEIPDCEACPCLLVGLLILRANLSRHAPLFSAVTRDGQYRSTPVSYSFLREAMLSKFAAIGLPKEKFGTHSCRAGGATMAANAGIPDRIWQEHGGWKSQRAANGYIKTNLQVKLSVTQTMFFASKDELWGTVCAARDAK